MQTTLPRTNVEKTVGLTVYRNFTREILDDEDTVIPRCALHVSIDPVTGKREISVFTDDGAGNGDGILTIQLD